MTYNKITQGFDVQPIDNEDGTLKSLRLDHCEWTQRTSQDGRALGPKEARHLASIEIPQGRVEEVLRELVSWSMYYASGQAARHSKQGWQIPGTETPVQDV